MPKGLLIDLDGTLADSLDALKTTYLRFLSDHGKRGTDDEFASLNGVRIPDVVSRLKTSHDIDGASGSLLALYNQLLEAAHSKTRPATGAVGVLKEARKRGWRIAVVTSASRKTSDRWIKSNQISDLVDIVVTADDVASGKPSPEPYAHAIKELNCSPSSSLAVEDSVVGATSAVAAGVMTLAITKTKAGWPPAVRMIDNLSDTVRYL